MTREIYTPSIGEILNVSEVTNMYKINLTDALLSSLMFSTLGEIDLAYLVGQVQIPSGSTAPVLGIPTAQGEGGNKKLLTSGAAMIGGDATAVATTGATAGPATTLSSDPPLALPPLQQQQDANGVVVVSNTAQQQALQLQVQQAQQHRLEMLARKHQPVFVGDIKLTEFKNRVLKQAGIEAEFLGDGVLVCNGVVAIRKVDQTGQILLEGSPMSQDYYLVRQLLYKQFALL